VVQEADENLQIRIHVTNSSGSADSAATSAVIDVAPALTAQVIGGVAQEGQKDTGAKFFGSATVGADPEGSARPTRYCWSRRGSLQRPPHPV
jgi:hypothetical protein